VDETGGLLVLTAIREERRAIVNALAAAHSEARSGAQGRVRVVETGDGSVRASRGAREAIAAFRPSHVLGAGVAGGLSPELAAGDIVASARVLDAAEEAPAPDPELLRRALALPGVRSGTVFSVLRPALTAAQKAALGARAGATAVVDMESAAWARACGQARVPYVFLRAISDTAEEDLPGYLAGCMDAEGSIRRAAVASRALLHPGSIPALLRIRGRVVAGGRALGEAVAALAASIPL